ncbi:DUF5050 domain-containing protein [Clostridium aestuarii]|uniref:DUF5050 domain-containing protein n=1 Tax=Clostridium aestuarii TaxID=338193 RepID=A0ABT4D2R4_9CLOT|nr:DUF5050 domain-containing protein [Clostridium aestuarii]MCY6485531.1 DUF5050 domain-containing protein [Clostridium aestuarii]
MSKKIYIILFISIILFIFIKHNPKFRAKIYTLKTSMQIEHVNLKNKIDFKRLSAYQTIKIKDFLIYKKGTHSIYKSNLNGDNEKLIYNSKDARGSMFISDIYVCDKWIILSDYSGILRINLSTNKKDWLFNDLVFDVKVKGNWIYFIYPIDSSRLYKIDINADNLTRLSSNKWISGKYTLKPYF